MEARHEINQEHALEFMKAGNAIMTIRSKKSGKHFTFKFITMNDSTQVEKPTWVRLLTGVESYYTFIGTIWGDQYRHAKDSRVTEEALGVISFKWWLGALVSKDQERLNQIELFHEGKCMKCGRKLTQPESIESGIGPVCAGKMKLKIHY